MRGEMTDLVKTMIVMRDVAMISRETTDIVTIDDAMRGLAMIGCVTNGLVTIEYETTGLATIATDRLPMSSPPRTDMSLAAGVKGEEVAAAAERGREEIATRTGTDEIVIGTMTETATGTADGTVAETGLGIVTMIVTGRGRGEGEKGACHLAGSDATGVVVDVAEWDMVV